MGRRSRIIGYGASLALVVVGAIVAVLRQDVFGDALAVGLVSIGLVAATSLVFYEVGLSEDRERARESAVRRASAAETPEQPPSGRRRPPGRLVRPRRTRGPR